MQAMNSTIETTYIDFSENLRNILIVFGIEQGMNDLYGSSTYIQDLRLNVRSEIVDNGPNLTPKA